MSGRTLRSSVKPPQDELEDVDMDSDASGGSESDVDESESDATTPTTDSKGKIKEVARRAPKQPCLEQPEDEPTTDDDESDESAESEEDEPTKKRKPAKKRTGGDIGRLQHLTNMPLEIVAEVCSHLDCVDLVRLSLSSRPIRELLLESTSAVIWASARRAAGLPDLTSNNMTEVQYAQLACIEKCQGCGRARVPQADYCLRKRMCKPCRKLNWLKVNNMHGKEFHAQTRYCVALTGATPASYGPGWYPPRYACVSDARIISAKLFELEAEDAEITAAKAKAPKAQSKSTATPHPHQKATTSKAVVKAAPVRRWRTGVPQVKKSAARSSLLADYVEKRKILVAKVLADGKAMHSAVVDLKATARKARNTENQQSRSIGYQRSIHIELKCRALGWDSRDFVGGWLTSSYINKAELLTDESWDAIKPKVLRILEKNKADRLLKEVALATKHRQSRLRIAHQTLRAAEPDDARNSFPIFGDFLHLSSVVPFWEPIDSTFVQIQWDAIVSDVQLEIVEHRESTRIHAIKKILLATTNASEEDLDGDDTAYDAATHGDAFFSAATSFLFCTLPGCRHKPLHRNRWYATSNVSRLTFFGSLPDLLEHQHELHSDVRFDVPSDGHFELPEVLADVIASLADAINVERDEVVPKDLDGFWYKWTSAMSKQGKYWEWRELLDAIHHKLSGLKGKKLALVEVEVIKRNV